MEDDIKSFKDFAYIDHIIFENKVSIQSKVDTLLK